ncbi:MAG: hypothetical protein FJ090_10845 [Deltaproteobacteria bacterium]|nr:hypothetical protein [Deltaproteobacteria bacterium]
MDRTDATTLATYTYLLHRAGIDAPSLASAVAAIDQGDESAVAALVEGASNGADPALALASLYGADRCLVLAPAADRDTRVGALRRALFGVSLPFLARIAHRDNGVLAERWVIVESFATTVKVLDPNPWDDKNEQHDLPLVDFLVRWELAGAELAGVRG